MTTIQPRSTDAFAPAVYRSNVLYLATILNWSSYGGVDLKQWPATHAYYQRMLTRPSVARACGEELTLYKEERIRPAS